ncbi:unnamed protein product [Amoebophrya sp. A120]|nr:unnamed protein product [Amoebophrya sp. A120]|eukprot:GSA120T00021453001.1
MIGDPLQLPPNPDTFELKEHFDFGTSLMERLINNGYPYKTLMRQSRMHPDISRLSRHTYPQLENHEAVVGALEKFPGLANRVHFWDTGSLYREVKERSVTNGEEAQRAVGIAQNLVYNGVPPEKIGVLAMYKGQARLIRDLIKRSENFGVEAFLKQPLPKKNALVSELLDKGRNPLSKSGGPAAYTKDEKGRTVSYSKLEDVAVDSVDNFQGDQRDYVIVSFCRSNDNHDCGFLKKADSGPQRLNVALTRARCGLFLIGDRACLETDYPVSGKDRKTHERLFDKTRPVPNAVFKNLFADLDEGKLVSKKLELHCERHPENGGLVCTTAADWALGAFQCRETCGKTLSACQHTCKQQCHPGLCPANLCREPVVVECPNGIADHPAWTAFCYEQGNAKCRSIVNFDCGRCRDDDLFSDPVQKQACKERRTPLSRLCFETEREVAKTCSATYHYTCRNGDHHYTRRCHEDEIAQCLQQTTCVRKDCGHLFEKRCYALDKTNTVEFEQLLEDLAETPCQEEVCEPCARCGEGALVRVCSEAQPRDRCRRKLPYHCAACGHESQRPCEVPEAEYRCPAVLEELCRDCGVATVKRVCSETAPQQPCTHEIDHTCVDCGEVAKKLCSAPGGSFVCQAVYPHTCGECGLVGDKQCGVRKYVCPALQPFNCGSCGAFVKHYQCGMPPTPEQLETDFLCLKEVDQECSECYTVGKRVCAMSPSEFVCRAPCKKVLPECGHPCARVCGLPCAREKSECRWCALELTKEWLNHGCLSEDKAPEHDYAVGTRCLLPVWKIEFTQASISTEMRSGASVDQQVEEIIRYCPEDLRPENFEKRFTCIKVYRMLECEYLRPILQDGSEGEPRAVWRTRFYALDNRRTALLKKCNPGGEVYVEISGDAKDFQSKYDPKGRAKLQHDEIRQVMGCAGPDKGAGVAPGAATATNKNKTKNKKVSKNKAAAPATDHEVLKGVEARTYGVAEGSSGTRFPSLKKKRKTNPNGKKANKKCNIEPFAATENVKVKNKNDGNNKKNKKNACKKQQSSSSSSADNEKSKASETPKGNDKNDDKREETEAEPTQAASSSQVFMQSLSGPLVHDDQDDSAGKKSNTKMYEEQVARLSAIFPAGEHGLVFAEAESVQISAEKSDLMSSPVVRIRGAGDAGRCKISNTEPLTAAPSPGSSSATKSTPGSRDYSMSPLPELDLQGESKSNTPAAAPPEGDPIPELLYPERPPLPGFDPVTIWRRPQKGKEEPRVKSKGAGKFAVVEHEQGKVVTRQILRTDAAGEMRNKAGTQIVLHHYELPIEPPEDHDDISLLRDGRRQRQIATSQRYVIIDDLDLVTDTVAGKSARAEVDLSSLETWATANLNAATPPTESPDCSAEGVSSRENTEVFERVVREAIDAPLRMMMESPVCLRKCLGFRRDAEPVVVVSSGLLYLLGLLHTTYVHDRFPDFSFQAYYDPDVRVMLLWRKIEEEFPERVTQHGVEGAREILRKSEERILAGKRFIQHVTSSRSTPTATCAPLSRDQEGVMRNANHAKLCNTTSTSTTSITCTLRRVPSLSCFLPVFPCQPHKNDPSFLLYGGGSYLRHGKQLQQNGKTLYAVVRKSNKKFREAADHGWKDKKLNSRIFFGANAYRQYNKLACGGTDGLLLGFYNEDDGRVEGVNAITSLEQFRNTFSWSLNHDLPQGGELYRVLFAQLFEKCARFSGKPLTVRKERGSAEEDHYGYQKAVTLRFEESSPGIDYSNELIDLIQSFTHKWQRIEQGRS